MGLLQSKLGIIIFLSKYEVAPCDKTLIPMVINPKGAVTSPMNGIHLNVRRVNINAN